MSFASEKKVEIVFTNIFQIELFFRIFEQSDKSVVVVFVVVVAVVGVISSVVSDLSVSFFFKLFSDRFGHFSGSKCFGKNAEDIIRAIIVLDSCRFSSSKSSTLS